MEILKKSQGKKSKTKISCLFGSSDSMIIDHLAAGSDFREARGFMDLRMPKRH